MLRKDPNERISLDKIIEFSWVKQDKIELKEIENKTLYLVIFMD